MAVFLLTIAKWHNAPAFKNQLPLTVETQLQGMKGNEGKPRKESESCKSQN